MSFLVENCLKLLCQTLNFFTDLFFPTLFNSKNTQLDEKLIISGKMLWEPFLLFIIKEKGTHFPNLKKDGLKNLSLRD